MNREALDKFFERGILALVLAILVFAPLAFGAVDAWAFLVVQGLTIGVMLLWALRIWISPKAAIALAADLLGRAGVHDLRCRALSHGGHRIRRATGDDSSSRLRVFVFRHRQQFVSAGIFTGHQLHLDFSGDGNFVLRGLSIFNPFKSRLEFVFAVFGSCFRHLHFAE